MTEVIRRKDLPALRVRLLRGQDHRCPICLRALGENSGEACADHSHRKRLRGSGLIRGVLCRTCNSFLAKSENNAVRYRIPLSNLPTILRSMANYLERPHTKFLHPSERPRAPMLTRMSYIKLIRTHDRNLAGRPGKVPPYPRRGGLTKALKRMYDLYGLTPRFYKSKG
jgi:hypothetical protein